MLENQTLRKVYLVYHRILLQNNIETGRTLKTLGLRFRDTFSRSIAQGSFGTKWTLELIASYVLLMKRRFIFTNVTVFKLNYYSHFVK